ncbi:unnamed protein product, partial [Mesorhabditis belari]|uniref:Large ribosomal subunit protein uL23m n=1 Tax=Mesorhabditis belari TaxID=2138241 RepID=A0AAF3J2F4_9BILA
MSAKAARLWQPGNPQRRVFLPDFWLALVETPTVGRHRIPKNCAKFEIDPRMSRHDVREYLTKIYSLPVRDVRIEMKMGDIEWQTKKDTRYKTAMWKEDDKKFAYVFMSKSVEFDFPDLFRNADELMGQVDKYKEQLADVEQNARYVNRDRSNVGKFFGL